MLLSFDGVGVRREGEAHIADNAMVVGNVLIMHDVRIGFNVVIRGDLEQITIGQASQINDGAVLHADPGFPLVIGRSVEVGGRVMLHGCRIGDGSTIGAGAVVLNGAKLGMGCRIEAGTLVLEGMLIPDRSLVRGAPAKIIDQLEDEPDCSL
ncbi:MAG: gamma carbonic anhydrase family protein [Alphaproteobacteria bacterium]|nr:MAG: gamma carbonic anhydrase family protein [Alphaproteobacteria bacterium]